MTVPYIVTGKTITLYLDGMPESVAEDHPFYARIVHALREGDEDELHELLSNPVAGIAEYVDGEVKYNGAVLHNTLVDRIMGQVSIGLSPDPMLRFLENLMQNPSDTSREELYEFLAHSYLPITEDGHFLGYKAVQHDYTDIHSGVYDNSVGEVIEMPRGDVDPDRHNHCSQGFHVGTMDYVAGFGRGNSRFLLVKVNPRDAVSVPADHGAQKLRCCKYEVVQEIERHQVLEEHVYSEDGGEALTPDEKYDGDWEADDYDPWDDDYDPWEDEEDEAHEARELEVAKDEYRQARIDFYMENWTRDAVVQECSDRGLTKGIEAGRRLRKEGCVALLAGDDTEDWFAD